MSACYDIVGYQYNAAIYCSECIIGMCAQREHAEDLDALMTQCASPAETLLDRYARRMSIDREDEASYDSGEFPKVVFRDQDEDDYCGACHQPLIEEDS